MPAPTAAAPPLGKTADGKPVDVNAAAGKPAKAKKKFGRKSLLFIAVVLLGAGGGGGWFWWQSRNAADHAAQAAQAKVRAPAQYYALEPAFVVNLADADSVRYLQADLQLMTRDADTRAALELHAPAIRNRLLLLFGQQSAAQLAQRSGKERLQDAARAEVHALLKAEGVPDKIEAVIFTSLVTQ